MPGLRKHKYREKHGKRTNNLQGMRVNTAISACIKRSESSKKESKEKNSQGKKAKEVIISKLLRLRRFSHTDECLLFLS